VEEQAARGIVEQATRAPSIHNTQPWRFALHADTIELWTDPARGLKVLDPSGRGRHISCGAALLHARLAAAAAGYVATVTVLPDPAEPTHLADLELHESQSGAPDSDLAAAITSRHTSREPFSNEPIAEDVVEAFRQAAATEGAWLRIIDTPEDATAVAVLLAHADEVQAADPAYVDELRQWTRRGERDDGIPAAARLRRPNAGRTTGCVTSSRTASPTRARRTSHHRWSGHWSRSSARPTMTCAPGSRPARRSVGCCSPQPRTVLRHLP